MRAEEVMTKACYSVKPEDKASKAVHFICRHNIAGMPVVDEGGRVVGVVSEKDILAAMYPSFAQFMADPLASMDFERMEGNHEEVGNIAIKKLMKSPAITATPETPLLKIGSMMLRKRIRRIPIVDDEGKLVGIMSQGDIHRSLFCCYSPSEE